jgi:ribose/xylose/arabinose/galactoside ABC-type transport system permease subunit
MMQRNNNEWNNISPQVMLLVVLLLLGMILSVSTPYFFRWDNLRNILDQSTLDIITGVGMTLIICSGGIDLSVGSVAALAGVLTAIALQSGANVPLAVVIGLSAGLLVGFFNGFLISLIRINPFIVTLASMSIIRGLTLIITGAMPISGFPGGFLWLGSGSVAILPASVVVAVAIAILWAVILNQTKLGYYALAMGGNEEALRRSGVAIHAYKIALYILCALAAAAAGLVMTARLNSADPTAGYMMEMDAIATAILGGTSMQGGVGSIGGTVIAGLLLAVLQNGLIMHGIASYYQQLLTGLIVIVAVIASQIKSRSREGIGF